MRKAAFSMAVLLLSAVWVVAQTTGTGQPQTATQPPSSTGTMTPGSGQNSQTPTATGQAPGNTQTGTNPSATTPPGTQASPATPQAGTTAQPGATSQTTPQAGTTAQPGATAPATSGPQQTVEGCLGGTPGEYSLTTKSGQVYMLSGDGSLLGDHVGEQVKVTGAQTSSSGAAGTSGTPGATATPSSGGAATGGTPYGSTGTTASQPGSPTQSQSGSMAGQNNGTASAGATSGTAPSPGQSQPGTATEGSGSRLQVSNLTKVSNFCNMPQPR